MISKVDLENLNSFTPEKLQMAVAKVHDSLSQNGFMLLSNVGVDQALLARVFEQSRLFFSRTGDEKENFLYGSAAENFGYQGLEKESLDPSSPRPDFKETFTMRNLRGRGDQDGKWPSSTFRQVMVEFYDNCFQAVALLQRLLASKAGVEAEFFHDLHSGENVTLRLLHYPAMPIESEGLHQWGAGAHTDYGMLTLLFQDRIAGLQVLDRSDHWLEVVTEPGEVVVNTGDLMERWSNGQYPSTLHRVKCKPNQERYSIAFFSDPDSETEIDVLPAFLEKGSETRYPPIKAGEHIQRKLEATHR
jgi:isopenicillin N synthase-like dioxygenase